MVGNQTTRITTQEKQTQQIVYHYTSQTGLLAIIKTKKIWATDIYYLNDSAEMKHAWEIAKKVLQTPGISKCPDEDRIIKGIISHSDPPLSHRLYVACFSNAKNKLSQWRAYGSESGSFSIGFDSGELKEYAAEHHTDFEHCVYQKDQQESRVHFVIEHALADYRSRLEKADKVSADSMPPVDIAINFFLQDFTKYMPILKDESYIDEKEYRLIRHYGELKHVLFRKGRSTVIPYIELDLPQEKNILSVREIFVGPTPNPELAVHAIKQLMEKEWIDPTVVRYCDIPYRSAGI
jgi:hypothetical protein